MTSSAYVFLEGLEEKPVICGRFELNVRERSGRFVYGRSYLERTDAFAIDPLHLPLNATTHTCLTNKGVFGVLADAGADAWGRKLIAQLHTTQPQNELEYLLVGASMGVGALSFSLSRSHTKPKRSRNSIDQLELLLQGKNAILAAEKVSDEVKQAFVYGSSMGGARPKTLLTHAGDEYLVKFNKADDLFNVARVEHATMRMLDELDGVSVAETKLITGQGIDSEDLLLVKRFDRDGERVSHHFISANSLLQKGTVTQHSTRSWYSYAHLAELLRQHSCVAEDAIELYKRLVFNVLIGNTDDHARNHALLYALRDPHGWRLSPAYDVLPISNSGQHSLGVGNDGRTGSIENLLSQAKRFGLKAFKAQQIVNQIRELSAEWPVYMTRYAVAEGDIQRLHSVIPTHRSA